MIVNGRKHFHYSFLFVASLLMYGRKRDTLLKRPAPPAGGRRLPKAVGISNQWLEYRAFSGSKCTTSQNRAAKPWFSASPSAVFCLFLFVWACFTLFCLFYSACVHIACMPRPPSPADSNFFLGVD